MAGRINVSIYNVGVRKCTFNLHSIFDVLKKFSKFFSVDFSNEKDQTIVRNGNLSMVIIESFSMSTFHLKSFKTPVKKKMIYCLYIYLVMKKKTLSNINTYTTVLHILIGHYNFCA